VTLLHMDPLNGPTYGLVIADLTGIEDFTALTSLGCGFNQLTTLDLSNNTALIDLECYYNYQLTTLDVSNCTALTFLSCSGNQLTTLDVSTNTALTYLYCDYNQLTTLDVSTNTALTYVECDNNQLTCLDVSNNDSLYFLRVFDNLLEQLNTKNGNWVNMTVRARNNNLTCVEVDNIGFATNNWQFDSFTTISTNCNYVNPCPTISAIEEQSTNKKLLRTIDVLGRETKGKKNQPLFYIYDDGTVEKRIVIE